jgi:hypothetical protein
MFGMPPFVIPTLVKWTLGALGAVVAAKWMAREWRRVNSELERTRSAPVAEVERAGLPKLQRDPATGIYRPRH